MKRRTIKKWMNRHINPHLRDLPNINGRFLVDSTGDLILGRNYSFYQGYILSTSTLRKPPVLRQFQLAEKFILEVLQSNPVVYNRAISFQSDFLRVRLIGFDELPEGVWEPDAETDRYPY